MKYPRPNTIPLTDSAGFLDLTQNTETHFAPLKYQFYNGVPHETDFLFFRNLDGGLFLDIGANTGQSAISAYLANKNFHIISFDPNPLLEPILTEIKTLVPRYEFFIYGLANEEATTYLYIPIVDNTYITPLATMDKQVFDRPENKARIEQFSSTGMFTIKAIPVEFKRLDQLALSPRVIKIDAEESEYAVLQGALQTIQKSLPILLIEKNSHNHDISRELTQLGYTQWCYDAEHNSLERSSQQDQSPNLLFIHQEDPVFARVAFTERH